MDNLTANPCTRCGKQRIVVKTYKKLEGKSLVTYTETSCPDLECQKIVNATLAKETERRLQSMSAFKRTPFQKA